MRENYAMDALSPSPTSSPTPKPTTAKSAPAVNPVPAVHVTGTVSVVQKPDDVPLADHLQGWGTVAAVLVALVLAIVETRRRRQDQADAKAQRNEDRADADRRLREEREAGDRRLQQQIDEQREQNRRQFIAEQLQKAALHWSENEIHLLPGVLTAIPDQYATIIRYLVRGEDYNNIAGFPPMSPVTHQALEQQLTARGLVNHGAEQYLVDKIQEQVRELAKEGKGSSWVQMHPRARELYRGGYDYKKIRHEWIYEEISDNIAELLGRTKPENSSREG